MKILSFCILFVSSFALQKHTSFLVLSERRFLHFMDQTASINYIWYSEMDNTVSLQ